MDIPSLRVRNTLASLFAPAQPVAPAMSAPQPMPEENNLNPILQGLMAPQNEAADRLKTILDNMPRREDYAPSTGRKIMAGVVGLGGIRPAGISGGQPVGFINDPLEQTQAREQILDQPFRQAMADYNAQLKPVSELAQTERATNTNNRLTAATMLRDENADNALKVKEEQGNAKLELEKDKLAQKREFAAIVKAKNEMPNAAQAEDKNGQVYTWDKKTGKFIDYLTDEEGNIVHSSHLPDQTKLEIQNGNRLQQIAAQGSQARQTVAAQGQKEINVSNQTLANKQKLKETVPGKNTSPVQGSTKTDTGKRVTVVDPKGNAYTLPEAQLSAFMKKNQGWKVQ